MKSISIPIFSIILVLSFSPVNAALIGVEELISGQRPDVIFNNEGTADYTASSDSFTLIAEDWKIVHADDSVDYLTDEDSEVSITINLTIDENGDMVGTGTMEEVVTLGEVTIKGQTYVKDDILLAGDVYAFGWGESGVELGMFDFLIDNLSGELVTDEIWPDDVDTGVIADAENLNGWGGSWCSDFGLDTVKGNKAPVPEPATVLLLGLGGLALLRKRR